MKAPKPPDGLPPGTYLTLSGADWSARASFGMSGLDLDPDAVTRATGIEPSFAYKRGDPMRDSGGRTFRNGLWSLRSDDALSETDDDLQDHLAWLLDQLEPRTAALQPWIADDEVRVEFFCGVFMEGANCMFDLRPEPLHRIAGLGVKLAFDVYAPDDVERDVVVVPEPQAADDLALRPMFAEIRSNLAASPHSGAGPTEPGSPLLVLRAVRYWSQADEAAFFRWLDELECVAAYRGQGMDLLVSLRPELMNDRGADGLTALFKRYEIHKASAPLIAGLANHARMAGEPAVWDLGISATDT